MIIFQQMKGNKSKKAIKQISSLLEGHGYYGWSRFGIRNAEALWQLKLQVRSARVLAGLKLLITSSLTLQSTEVKGPSQWSLLGAHLLSAAIERASPVACFLDSTVKESYRVRRCGPYSRVRGCVVCFRVWCLCWGLGEGGCSGLRRCHTIPVAGYALRLRVWRELHSWILLASYRI